MGGRIGFESKEGSGTTFWFEMLIETKPELYRDTTFIHLD
ncbi:MAG: signal transduction histidine kinase [Polaribacter sp.]|jgi:signal transduction histidine kinase